MLGLITNLESVNVRSVISLKSGSALTMGGVLYRCVYLLMFISFLLCL